MSSTAYERLMGLIMAGIVGRRLSAGSSYRGHWVSYSVTYHVSPRRCLSIALLVACWSVQSIGATGGTGRGSPSLAAAQDLTGALVDPAGNARLPSNYSGHFGRWIDLRESGIVKLDLHGEASIWGGTVSFWLKPDWSAASDASHTVVSGRWGDRNSSYFVISEGWWEPEGKGRLYAVVSNIDELVCTGKARLIANQWQLITIVWSGGPDGYCKLFVDDELVGERHHPAHLGKTLKSLFFGSDVATDIAAGRRADAAIAGIKVLGYAAKDREIVIRYSEEADPGEYYARKWSWLDRRTASMHQALETRKEPVRRAVFDEDMGWAVSAQAIDQRLARIAAAGFNDYVVCVWHGRGTFYPGSIAAPDPRLRGLIDRGWDPLAYLIERAHASGIRIHAWFTIARRENEMHPEWTESGSPPGAFDVHEKGFRDFAVNLVSDIATRYSIDGINLDYVRSMGVCTSSSCESGYFAQMGRRLEDDLRARQQDRSARGRLRDWQDAAVRDIVTRVSSALRSTGRQIVLSVDGHATGNDDDRELEGRDEIAWTNSGLIDGFFQMDYEQEPNLEEIDEARRRLKDPFRLWVLLGNYDLIDGEPVPRSGTWLKKSVAFFENASDARYVGVYILGQLDDDQVRELSKYRSAGANELR